MMLSMLWLDLRCLSHADPLLCLPVLYLWTPPLPNNIIGLVILYLGESNLPYTINFHICNQYHPTPNFLVLHPTLEGCSSWLVSWRLWYLFVKDPLTFTWSRICNEWTNLVTNILQINGFLCCDLGETLSSSAVAFLGWLGCLIVVSR